MVGDRFVRRKAASNDWLNAQHIKEVGTGCHRGDHFRAGRSVDDVYIVRGKCDIGNVRGCLLQLRDLGVGGCESLIALAVLSTTSNSWRSARNGNGFIRTP